ncbi:MAG: acyl-CoA dehydrogenase family protein [Alkalilacustris sp.]
MVWGLTGAAQQMRDRTLEFCDAQLPDEIRRKVLAGEVLAKADYVRWQKIMHRHGFMGGHWPRAHGGQGWSPLERWVAEQAMAEAGAPWLIPTGVAYVGPVLYTFGSAAQQARFLPPILTSDHWWAQGYSEPEAGSDLAALRTRADRSGDRYVVTGRKLWTTYAHWADWIFCLARTGRGERPQEGISFLLIDMTSPGITVRPIRTIDGAHHVNEVVFDAVEVPAENLVGEEGAAWTYSKFLLAHERLISGETGKARRLLAGTRAIAEGLSEGGRPLAEDPSIARRLAEAGIALRSLEAVCVRLLEAAEGARAPGLEANIMKLRGTELLQQIQDLAVDCLGRRGLWFDPTAPADAAGPMGLAPACAGALGEFLLGRAYTIWGGSNEIQRNILVRAALNP